MSDVATQPALILKVAATGESFLRLDVLGAKDGLFVCLKRISSKQISKGSPDLFDTVELQVDRAKSGNTLFVRELQVLHRRGAIGSSYQNLQYASDYATLLAKNSIHMPDPSALYQLAERTFNAFAERAAAPVVYLKGLYLLLQTEGFPVRESWWPRVPHPLRESAKQLINQPSPASNNPSLLKDCEALISDLTRWINLETDLIL